MYGVLAPSQLRIVKIEKGSRSRKACSLIFAVENVLNGVVDHYFSFGSGNG